MRECMWCGKDHDAHNDCNASNPLELPPLPEQTPSQKLLPSLHLVLDQLVLEAQNGKCDGTCSDEKPFKKCNECIAGAALSYAAELLCAAWLKCSENKGEK